MKKVILLIVFLMNSFILQAQSEFEFNGMLTGFTNYNHDAPYPMWSGVRYIPEANFEHQFDSLQSFSLNASANMYGSVQYPNTQGAFWDGYVQPYRLWARYAHGNHEIRVGLQKIDFGSSSLLRPMQWFNQIDPRDPLGLTNGVYSALGRYYFKNNANLWVWVLYGNEDRRGYDILESNKKKPEYGGRFQYPTAKGEIAFSYHHRNAVLDTREIAENPLYVESVENKWGLDGKWDLGIGLWFEATYTREQQNVGMLTNQSLLNLGVDYTFGIGNGLNAIAEHLFSSYAEKFGESDYNGNTSALSLNYPIGFYDNINAMVYHDWGSNGTGFFAGYNHQFPKITAYLMMFYNPVTEVPIRTNDLSQISQGFGVNVLLVFNH